MGERIRAYIADDHPILREGLAALVEREGDIDIVGQTGNGLDVLSDVLNLSPDVAVVDIGMPGLNGLDVCREIARSAKGTLVLILTMEGDEEFVVAALRNGASGYLTKEAAPEQFCEAIRIVARGGTYLSPGIPPSVLERLDERAPAPYDTLTTRERQVLHMVAESKTNRQIAEALGIAMRTVDTHRTHLMRKLDIHDQTSLVKFAIKHGVIRVRAPKSTDSGPGEP